MITAVHSTPGCAWLMFSVPVERDVRPHLDHTFERRRIATVEMRAPFAIFTAVWASATAAGPPQSSMPVAECRPPTLERTSLGMAAANLGPQCSAAVNAAASASASRRCRISVSYSPICAARTRMPSNGRDAVSCDQPPAAKSREQRPAASSAFMGSSPLAFWAS